MYNHVNKMVIGYGNEAWGRPAGVPAFPAATALYRFDGNGVDSSGNWRHLSVGTPAFAAGKFGQGSTASLTTDAGLNITGLAAVSISAWFKTNGVATGDYLGAKLENPFAQVILELRPNPSSRVVSLYRGETLLGATPAITSGVWNHVACSMSATKDWTLWLNGVKVASGNDSGWATAWADVLIASAKAGNMELDDLAFVNSALTAAQIRYLAAGNRYPSLPLDYLLRDTFTDADGTPLASHTMDVGGGWTIHAGDWEINGNRAKHTGGAHEVVTGDAGVSDAVVSATAWGAPGTYPGLCGRVTDNNNFFGVECAVVTGQALMYQRSAGGFTARGSGSHVAILPDSDFDLSLSIIGDVATVFVNGDEVVSYTGVGGTQTLWGLWSYTTQETFEDFQVTAP